MARKDGAYKLNYSKLVDVKQVKIKYHVIAVLKYVDGNIKETGGFKTDVSRYGSITDESIFCSETLKLSCNFFCDSRDVLQALEPYVIIMFHRIKVDMYKDNLKALASKRCGTSWALFSGDVDADFNCLSSSVNKTITLSDDEKNRISDLRKWLALYKDTMVCSENPYFEATLSQVKPGLIFRLPCLILRVEKDANVCYLYVADGSVPKQNMETFELSSDATSKVDTTLKIARVIDNTDKVFDPNSLSGQFKYLVLHAFEETVRINEDSAVKLKMKLINEIMDVNENQLSVLKNKLHYIENGPTTSSKLHGDKPNTENEIIGDNPSDVRHEDFTKDNYRCKHRILESIGHTNSDESAVEKNTLNDKENLPKQLKHNNDVDKNQDDVRLSDDRFSTRTYMNYLASFDHNNAPLTEHTLNLFTYTQAENDFTVAGEKAIENQESASLNSGNNEKIISDNFINESFLEDSMCFDKFKKTLNENLITDSNKILSPNIRKTTSTQQNTDSISSSHHCYQPKQTVIGQPSNEQKICFSHKATCTLPKEDNINDDIFRRVPTKRQKNEVDFLFDHRRIPKTFTSNEWLGVSCTKINKIRKHPYTGTFKVKALFLDYKPKIEKSRYPYIVWSCNGCSYTRPIDDINEKRLSREIDKWILSKCDNKENLICPKCQNFFELVYNFEIFLMDLNDDDKEIDTDDICLFPILAKEHAVNFLGGIEPIDVLSYKKSFEKLKKRIEKMLGSIVICIICSSDEHNRENPGDCKTSYLLDGTNFKHERSSINKSKKSLKNRKYTIVDTYFI